MGFVQTNHMTNKKVFQSKAHLPLANKKSKHLPSDLDLRQVKPS